MKESMSFMHGSETKLHLKLDASHHLSTFYILQAKCSVRLKSQGLERERHKLTLIRKWQHWKKTLTFFYSPLSYNSFLVLFQIQLAQPISGGLSLNAARTGYRTINLSGYGTDEIELMPGRYSKCHEHLNKNCFCIISFFSFALVFWNIS